MTKQQILDAMYEGLNGLSMGWMMANVRDDAKRAELQAPINAGYEALRAAINTLESSCDYDDDRWTPERDPGRERFGNE